MLLLPARGRAGWLLPAAGTARAVDHQQQQHAELPARTCQLTSCHGAHGCRTCPATWAMLLAPWSAAEDQGFWQRTLLALHTPGDSIYGRYNIILDHHCQLLCATFQREDAVRSPLVLCPLRPSQAVRGQL